MPVLQMTVDPPGAEGREHLRDVAEAHLGFAEPGNLSPYLEASFCADTAGTHDVIVTPVSQPFQGAAEACVRT